jgi:FkbM family methyltransferase
MNILEDLKNLPRFSKGSIVLEGLCIHYNDPLALYHEYRDIFINKVYDFKPRSAAPVILDVGGYIGLSAMYFKTAFPGAKITVFEPDPAVFTILKTNIENNGFADITAVNAGVGKKNGKIPFISDGADGGSTFVQTGENSIEVKIIKLSDYIEGTIDLLKMNIEGMEGEVFAEIERKLPLVKEILFEYHAFYDLPQQLGDILMRLDKKGFRYLVTDVPCAKTPVPFRMGKKYRNFNLVYAKSND